MHDNLIDFYVPPHKSLTLVTMKSRQVWSDGTGASRVGQSRAGLYHATWHQCNALGVSILRLITR